MSESYPWAWYTGAGQLRAEEERLGVRTGLVERGRLLPESERLIAGFQRQVAQALT